MNKRIDIPRPVRADQITCRISGVFDFSEIARAHQEQTWLDFVARRPQAFDGPLVRLCRTTILGSHVYLDCERTSFSEYIASRDPSFEEVFPGVERANPIGMTVIVLGSDRHVLVSHRSLSADQNPGALYFVGGYAEPPQVDGPIDLFEEAARELREETGITAVDMASSWILGLGYDESFCHPEITFLLRPSLCRKEMEAHLANAVDAHETHSFQILDIDDLLHGEACAAPMTWSFRQGCSLLRRMTDLVAI